MIYKYAIRKYIKRQKTLKLDKESLKNDNLLISIIINDIKQQIGKGYVNIENIETLKFIHWKTNAKAFRTLKFKSFNSLLKSKVLEDITCIKDVNNGFCVPEAIYNQLIGQRDRIKLKKKDIYESI